MNCAAFITLHGVQEKSVNAQRNPFPEKEGEEGAKNKEWELHCLLGGQKKKKHKN